jgi:hypothetical protein
MKIKVNPGEAFQTKWSEYAVRFAIGGGITVAAGFIAERFGPAIELLRDSARSLSRSSSSDGDRRKGRMEQGRHTTHAGVGLDSAGKRN